MKFWNSNLAASVVLLVSAVIAVQPAKAAVLDFSFTGLEMSDGGSFSIVNGVAVTDASNVVISLSGQIVGFGSDFTPPTAITLVAPGTPGFEASWVWDGKMFATPDYFSNTSTSGILFTFDGSNVGNLYLGDASQIFLSVNTSGELFNPGDPGTLTVSAVAAIPEPTTWAMMMIGFCGIGFLAYRRKSRGELRSA